MPPILGRSDVSGEGRRKGWDILQFVVSPAENWFDALSILHLQPAAYIETSCSSSQFKVEPRPLFARVLRTKGVGI